MFPLGNVWCVGDSKTFGVTDPPGSCAYRDPMYTFMTASGGTFVGTLTGGADGLGGNLTPCPISGLPLASDGHNGFHFADVNVEIAGWYGTIATPNVVILHLGTNDLIAYIEGVSGFTTDRLYSDFQATMGLLMGLNPNMTIFVCTMDPMPSLINFQPLYNLNQFIRSQVKMYQRQGKNVYLIDLYTALTASDYNAGGIHQSVGGYANTNTRIVSVMKTLNPVGG